MANWNDTSPGIDLNQLPHFPLTKIRSGALKAGSSVVFDGITATTANESQEVLLRGVGKSGKRWEVHLSALDRVWRADLDGNGNQDYVFVSAGPYGNGRMTPLYSLSILLMDDDHLPVPFFTPIYNDENGLQSFVDLNRDGRAELLISTYDEIPSDSQVGPFCSGHWITQAYLLKNLGLEEVRGNMGSVRFPVIRDWSYGSAKCPGTGTVQPPSLHENGTAASENPQTILLKSSGPNSIAIQPVAGCKAILPRVVVYDRRDVRKVAFPNPAKDHGPSLTDAIRHDGAHVKLRGVGKASGDGRCSVNLLWAQ